MSATIEKLLRDSTLLIARLNDELRGLGKDVQEKDERIASLLTLLDARIAEVSTLKGEREAAALDPDGSYVDTFGTAWMRPTAFAYAMVCKARAKWFDRYHAEHARVAELERELEDRRARYETNDAALQQRNAELKCELEQLRDDRQVLRNEVNTLHDQEAELKQELDGCRGRVAELTSTREQLRDDWQRLQRIIETARAENTSLRKRLRRAIKSLSNLLGQHLLDFGKLRADLRACEIEACRIIDEQRAADPLQICNAWTASFMEKHRPEWQAKAQAAPATGEPAQHKNPAQPATDPADELAEARRALRWFGKRGQTSRVPADVQHALIKARAGDNE